MNCARQLLKFWYMCIHIYIHTQKSMRVCIYIDIYFPFQLLRLRELVLTFSSFLASGDLHLLHSQNAFCPCKKVESIFSVSSK